MLIYVSFNITKVLQLLVGSNINKDQLSHIAERTLLECNGGDSDQRIITYEAFKEVGILEFKVSNQDLF